MGREPSLSTLAETPRDRRRVVILGAGFGGLEAAKKLGGSDFEVILLDRNNYHLFQPLLYQVATAGLEPDSIAYPVRSILRRAPNVHFRLTEVRGIDRSAKRVVTDLGPIRYDSLVVAAGSRTNFFGQGDNEAHSLELKTLESAIEVRNRVLFAFEEALAVEDEAERSAWMTIVVVGGGPTGVELAGAFSELVRHVLVRDFPTLDADRVRIVLLEGLDRLLPGFDAVLRDEARARLERMGVEVRTSSRVDRIEPGHVLLESGEGIESRTIVWSAGVRGVELAKDLTRSPAHGGRVPVTPELRLPDDPDVYVIGDLAYVDGELPMMAPVAIQQARTAVDNILRGAEGRPLRSFRYKNRGMMATIGRKSAVATLYGRNFKGYFAWAIWLVVHLFWLIGFRNKLVVLINWIYHYFRYERGVRLITRTPARQPADSRMPAKSAPRDDSGSEGRGS